MTAQLLHDVLHWVALAALVAAAVAAWIPAPRRMLFGAMWTALFALTAVAAIRWAVTGHPPIFGTFENSIAASWYLLVAALLSDRVAGAASAPFLRRLLLGWAVAIAGYGSFFASVMLPLTISERSLWVDVHVLLAWSAFTVLLVGSNAALAVLLGREDARDWDKLMFAALCVGFPVFTLMLAVGSVYSFLLFADFYRWEITESLCAVAWLGYASAVHARLFFGWRGKRLAWIMLALLPVLVASFWVWSVYSGTYHHFEVQLLRAR